MKKWYEIQFVVVSVVIVLTFTFTFCGEIMSGKYFLYGTEVFTSLLGGLVVSGVLMILFDLYGND